ncbi:Energy-coupling factor transporter ATP-binding protein EcfA2 [compost metagenome]
MDYRLEAGTNAKPTKGLFKKRKHKVKVPAGLRKRVGLVFQFPEQQLFEETIEKDICFGPINFGASQAEALEAAHAAAAYMGLDEELLHRSPFQVSGGQLRKAAIAAVLAADPDIIVLDEPTASLDQQSRTELMQLLHTLNREQGKTIIVVTHRLGEVLPYADQYVVMDSGTCLYQGDAAALIARPDLLERAGIESPAPIRLLAGLAEQLGAEPPAVYMDAASTADWIISTMKHN